jgi:hypothetical protein
MRVKIKNLLLWQWNSDMVKREYWSAEVTFTAEAEEIILELMEKWNRHGYLRCRCIPPISVNRSLSDLEECLTPEAIAQFRSGKMMVWNGFHRIHAAIRLGKKTIKARIY